MSRAASRSEHRSPAPLAPELQRLKERARADVPGLEEDEATVGIPAFRVPRERLLEAASALRGLRETPLDYLTCLSGVDYPDRIDVVYHLFSIAGRVGLVLKSAAPKLSVQGAGGRDGGPEGDAAPPGVAAEPWLPSVTGLWPGANWHEREVFDLLGVQFPGHPDLRRILMPEGFSGGYPLRKDYVDQREQRTRKVRAR